MEKINASNYSPPNVNYWADRCCKAEAEIARLKQEVEDAKDGALRLHREKVDYFEANLVLRIALGEIAALPDDRADECCVIAKAALGQSGSDKS